MITPEEGKMYTIRDLIRNSDRGQGLLLEELSNPMVPITHPIFGKDYLMEPNFAIRRFTNLQGQEITREEIKEILKQTKCQLNKS